MSYMNQIFESVRQIPPVALDDLTLAQKEAIKTGLADDVAEFGKKHPGTVENWTVTNAFLSS